MTTHSSLKGAFWAVMSALCFATLMTLNKYAKGIPIPLMTWGRCFFAACTILPFLKIKALNHCIPLQLLRGMFVTGAMFFTYTAYQILPLHEASLLGTTGPLFIVLLSIMFLKERLSPKGWMIFSLGYIGIALIMVSKYINAQGALNILSPWWAKAMMLISSLFSACVVSLGRLLSTKKVSSQAILFYSTVCPLMAYTFYLPFSFVALTFQQWMILGLLGIFGAGSAGTYLLALSHASASFLAPFEYLRPVFLIPIGMIFFGQYPSWIDFVGGLCIVGASLWITHHQQGEEKKLK